MLGVASRAIERARIWRWQRDPFRSLALRRWFREQAGTLIPLVADTRIAASDYRFRLRSLCLLAAQCDVANMDSALNALAQQDMDDEEGDAL